MKEEESLLRDLDRQDEKLSADPSDENMTIK